MRRLAALLRKIAQRIDPQPDAIEWFSSDQITHEFLSRNANAVVYWEDDRGCYMRYGLEDRENAKPIGRFIKSSLMEVYRGC